MKIRAVCSDIDGTLLDHNRALSPRTIDAIKNIRDKVPVILASSRMPGAMRHLQTELGIMDHPMICYNGGYVIYFENELSTPHVVDSVQIPLSICKKIIALARSTAIHLSLYAEDEWYTPKNDQWAERETMTTKVSPILRPFENVLESFGVRNSGMHKIMCMGPESEIAEMYTTLLQTFFNEIHIYRSKPTYLEIAPKIISKATALGLILKKCFDINLEEVMAFGDNYNDVEMIGAVGYGIAVENAIPEVKSVAREVTLSGKQDGVAVAIEKYFMN